MQGPAILSGLLWTCEDLLLELADRAAVDGDSGDQAHEGIHPEGVAARGVGDLLKPCSFSACSNLQPLILRKGLDGSGTVGADVQRKLTHHASEQRVLRDARHAILQSSVVVRIHSAVRLRRHHLGWSRLGLRLGLGLVLSFALGLLGRHCD